MNKRRLFWGGLLVLFSVLFFVALSAGFVDTLFDYRTFSGINGSAKFGVSTTNPVGIFGLVVSYWGYHIFGNYFVYLIDLLLLLFGLVLFFPKRGNFLLTKVFSFFVFSLFFYFLLATEKGYRPPLLPLRPVFSSEKKRFSSPKAASVSSHKSEKSRHLSS